MKKYKMYIAYGSNLNLKQMSYRCPYAVIAGAAALKNYRLLFRGRRSGAVATVEPCEGESVPVLLWKITPRDETALDIYEGYPNLYRKETLEVSLDGRKIKAMIYIMNEKYPVGVPNEGYYKTIAEGYQSSNFDVSVLDEAVRFSAEIMETAE
jgi:gamma-glutamylcyclotransferase (GGCT)/AIG2-like uncharacterized protein YtfP